MSDISRFGRYVDRADLMGCWPWTGGTVRGYGVFSRRKASTGKWGAVRAHRAAWELICGPIPDGMVVAHRCDNPRCVKITHLCVCTQADNLADMTRKGRRRSRSVNAEKSHCIAGHPFADANLRVWTNPKTGEVKRYCRECHRTRERLAYQARSLAAKEAFE